MNGKSSLPSKAIPLSNCSLKFPSLQPHLLPSSLLATPACPMVNIDLLGHSSPRVHSQAESSAQLCAASPPSPAKGELCWMSCAGENTATLSGRKLKGALLHEKIKENLKQTPREKGCPYRKYSSLITMVFYGFSI